ncbi:MAG: alginate lyase family protein [Lachnospiraceae bacterium]|nr:alginate lyase family protein [Lachnospiraceae bacterium]
MKESEFFQKGLNLEYEGLERVKQAVEAEDYEQAKAELASYIRRTLEPERFFSVPYEEPENVYKLEGETVSQACERVVEDHVMVSVGVPCDFGREKEVDWFANPTYNGYKEWTWQLSRHPEWKMLAHAYRENGDKRYAERTAELFESWYHQAVCPGDEVSGYDTACWRTIECGIRMGANWPYVLFTFYDTEAFTDQVLTDWYISVWEHGNRLYKNCTRGNWLVMEMNGLAQIGILYPQLKESGKWLETAFSRLEEELDRQVYPDGFQYELSTIYHEVVVNNYQRVMEMAQAFAVPVPAGMLKKLENAVMADVKLMMPDGRVPSLNDGNWFSVKHLLERKRRMLPDVPEFLWVSGDGKEGHEPEFHSIAMPYSGFLVMRSGWEPDAVWALFDGAPFGRAHQHEDKLSVLLYAEGKLLLTEGGNYAYDDSPMRRYVLSTRAHNTAMVDGMSQNRRRDYQWNEEEIRQKADLAWNMGPHFEYGESNYREGYGPEVDKRVNHNRCLYFVKNLPEAVGAENHLPVFFLVVDRFEAEEEHTYQALWHVDSENPVISPSGVRFDELQVCVSGRNRKLTVVKGQEEPEWQGFVSISQRQGDYRPVNCVQAEVQAGSVRMVTVLAPGKRQEGGASAAAPEITAVEAGTGISEDTITVILSDGSRLELSEAQMKADR